ncbi:LPXTG cell wall anchor domain-containing protein, partial [Kitasatospora aureofaciens]|uniref:LPXTG cell wall anchor domain-containing protein n=1 Tax=Kitasatospora aureofaciens TaxID=1894 RepID=UPI00061DBDB6
QAVDGSATTDTAPAPPDPSTAPVAVPAAQVTTGAPSPAAETAQSAAGAPAAVTATRLASTGGGSSSAPMAITGATAIALGIGTLLVARRRNGAQGARN